MKVEAPWDRIVVWRIQPDEGLQMTWDDVERFVLPEEAERWEHIRKLETVPYEALRKLKFLA